MLIPSDRVGERLREYTTDELSILGNELADLPPAEAAARNPDNFLVRPQRRYVEKYDDRAAWGISHPGPT